MPSSLLVFGTMVLLNILCMLHMVNGRDLYYKTIISTPNDECKKDEDVETLCQICAKRTKSNLVYPMCCHGEEETKEWCDRYINYGKQPTYYAYP